MINTPGTIRRTLLVALLAAYPFAYFTCLGQLPADTLTQNERLHLAVIAPLYLDSAFDAQGAYRYKKNIPSYIATGIDYFIGMQLAMDSLAAEKKNVTLHLFDARDSTLHTEALVLGDTLKNMHLIAGFVNVNEAALLSRFARKNGIPFINLNLPNAANSVENPFHIVMNPTLGTHCQFIYRYIQRNHALSPVYFITKKGTQEDRIREYLEEGGRTTAGVPFAYKTLEVTDSLDIKPLRSLLDSNKTTVFIVGSMDINFCMKTCAKLAQLAPHYPMQVIGMPTWDQYTFPAASTKGLELLLPTTFYPAPDKPLTKQSRQEIFNRYFIRAKDVTLRCYELLYLLCHLTPGKGEALIEQITKSQETLYGQLKIEPVWNKLTGTPDYYENKKLFFIKKLNGVTTLVDE